MTGKNAKQKAEFIEHLHVIVEAHLDQEDFDVKTLTGLAGVSRSELYRRIKSQTGKSVTEFIRDIRLHKGMELLRDTDLTAAEISYKVGFNSPTYFNKCFKDKYGITPGEADKGKQPEYKSIYEAQTAQPERKSGVWHIRNSWIMIGILIILGLGSWYYISVQNNGLPPSEPLEEKADIPLKNLKNNSVAVLPLKNWTGEKDYNYICYGMSDAIIARLTALEAVDRITPLSAINKAQDTLQDLDTLADTYEVGNLLTGNIQKSGNQLKFSFQFYNVASRKIHWMKEFIIQWDPEQAFELQKSISREIAMTLDMNFDKERFTSITLPTSSTLAYNNYLKGIYESTKSTREGFELSSDFFEKAIEADPDFLHPYIALAQSWLLSCMIWAYCSQEEGKKNALKYLDMAVDKGIANTEVLRIMSNIRFYYELNAGNTADSIPGLAFFDLSDYSQDFAKKIGNHAKNERIIREVLKEDPYNGLFISLLAQSHYFNGDADAAQTLLDASYEDYKASLDFLREAGKTYYFLEDYDGLSRVVQDFTFQFEERPPVLDWLRLVLAEHNNEVALRKELLQHLETAFDNKAPGSPGWFIALYYAHKKNAMATLSWLERSYAAKEVEMTWLAQEPDLELVGDHPRYIALLDSMNFPESARKHVKLLD
ncbi:helix-turn-helix domain-containing protein [Robertkochia flava]|uniref:helix-turn-helix domain-containing protein n=1 Tax=Robertkochia flava TaxID=3447986 RepID=UPI001CCFF463|nr:helix-turn-helix domain-containing protein [Robertkochia marina]